MIPAIEALRRLIEGNRRFVAHRSTTTPHLTRDERAELAAHQEPFAIILGCSDSRVPAEHSLETGVVEFFDAAPAAGR